MYSYQFAQCWKLVRCMCVSAVAARRNMYSTRGARGVAGAVTVASRPECDGGEAPTLAVRARRVSGLPEPAEPKADRTAEREGNGEMYRKTRKTRI